MKSSDQRYHHVQRQKRDRREWEQVSRDLVRALRDVRTGEGEFAVVEDACRRGAAEFSHILLACGRTNTDFRRNYRVGSPNWHTIAVNQICPVELSRQERLDGFSIMRLSREQTKNVKFRWAKLAAQDVLVHDPQGVLWAEALGCWIDGKRKEHLSFIASLRDSGIPLLRENLSRGDEQKAYFEFKTNRRPIVRPFEARYPDEAEHEASCCFSMVLADHAVLWRKSVTSEAQAKIRTRIEHNLVVAEAFMAGQGFAEAWSAPDTSQRHCSEARLKQRIDAIGSVYGESWRDIIEAQRETWLEAVALPQERAMRRGSN